MPSPPPAVIAIRHVGFEHLQASLAEVPRLVMRGVPVVAQEDVALVVGAIFPRFNIPNIHQLESSAGGFVYMAASLFYIGLTIAIEAWLAAAAACVRRATPEPSRSVEERKNDGRRPGDRGIELCRIRDSGLRHVRFTAPFSARHRGNLGGSCADCHSHASSPNSARASSAILGSTGVTAKYPLFRCRPRTAIGIGNHVPPNRIKALSDEFRGVTHHFKWKRTAVRRITSMIDVDWPWAKSESIPYLRYLDAHGQTLPLDGAFVYARNELFRRGLLRRPAAPVGVQMHDDDERVSG